MEAIPTPRQLSNTWETGKHHKPIPLNTVRQPVFTNQNVDILSLDLITPNRIWGQPNKIALKNI